jgi:hypothetical protein
MVKIRSGRDIADRKRSSYPQVPPDLVLNLGVPFIRPSLSCESVRYPRLPVVVAAAPQPDDLAIRHLAFSLKQARFLSLAAGQGGETHAGGYGAETQNAREYHQNDAA